MSAPMTPQLAGTPSFRTPRFTLRAPRPSDYPAWRDFFVTDRARFVGGGADQDIGRAFRAFAAITGHWVMHGFGPFVIADRGTDAPLGATGPWFPDLWPEREIGWTLWTPQAEGTGIMAEAVPAVLAHSFATHGWTTLVSYIHKDNARSIALAERVGAVRDAVASGPTPDDLVYRHQPAQAQ